MPDYRAPLDLRFPWSGDVSQTINPWTWILRSANSQFGLININLGKSADPELEQRILDDVGSYGRQIGKIGEALDVLLDRLDPQSLKPQEREAVEAFRVQLREVQAIKQRRRTETVS